MSVENIRKELLWLSDADNTLWDTDSLYREAQLGLLRNVENATLIEGPREKRLDFVRTIDQTLSLLDHRGLKYPISLLVSAVSQVLQGQSVERATKQAVRGSFALSKAKTDEITFKFNSVLSKCPVLREGVVTGLNALSESGATVMVITESDKERTERLLVQTGLSKLIVSVIGAKKSVALYVRLSKFRHHSTKWMIGDQIDRDVLMAAQAGMRTAYFPGGFRPWWDERSKSLPNDCIKVADYKEAVFTALRDRI